MRRRKYNSDGEETTRYRTDHGENFVPGAETAPQDQAPKSLDHFKRGYHERAQLRERSKYEQEMNYPRSSSQNRQEIIFSGNSDKDDNNELLNASQRDADLEELVQRLARPGSHVHKELDDATLRFPQKMDSGVTFTVILSNLTRLNKIHEVLAVWDWMERKGIKKHLYHYNSLVCVSEKMRDWRRAVDILAEMERENVKKNEVTFSSAISACEKCGNYEMALELLDKMKAEGLQKTTVAYNAAISACEKALKPNMAIEVFQRMKAEGCEPTVVTYSALISACEKGGQWKLSLEFLDEMRKSGFAVNVIAYSAAISACARGQQWETALELFREIEDAGVEPSVITCNSLMSALEKGLQWERALDLFDEMKFKRMPITVVSFGSAISACDKGCQWKQCLDYLDEMTEKGIKKNVIIFGAAMSCMEKSCRADIAFKLMEAMKVEGVKPNVHIYNSIISTCARCNLWEKGYELFQEMDKAGITRDVVTYNAVLDAVCCNIPLGRKIFQEGIEKGFYAKVSRLGEQWLELDLHFLSFGGGEIALWWWFEECLVPYLVKKPKLASVQTISIVTGSGRTRWRGVRIGNDSMHKRVSGMLRFMNITSIDQANKGRITIDRDAFIHEVEKNGGKIVFDAQGYQKFKEEETSSNKVPITEQFLRHRDGAPRKKDFFRIDRTTNESSRNGHNGVVGNMARQEKYDFRNPIKSDSVVSITDRLTRENDYDGHSNSLRSNKVCRDNTKFDNHLDESTIGDYKRETDERRDRNIHVNYERDNRHGSERPNRVHDDRRHHRADFDREQSSYDKSYDDDRRTTRSAIRSYGSGSELSSYRGRIDQDDSDYERSSCRYERSDSVRQSYHSTRSNNGDRTYIRSVVKGYKSESISPSPRRRYDDDKYIKRVDTRRQDFDDDRSYSCYRDESYKRSTDPAVESEAYHRRYESSDERYARRSHAEDDRLSHRSHQGDGRRRSKMSVESDSERQSVYQERYENEDEDRRYRSIVRRTYEFDSDPSFSRGRYMEDLRGQNGKLEHESLSSYKNRYGEDRDDEKRTQYYSDTTRNDSRSTRSSSRFEDRNQSGGSPYRSRYYDNDSKHTRNNETRKSVTEPETGWRSRHHFEHNERNRPKNTSHHERPASLERATVGEERSDSEMHTFYRKRNRDEMNAIGRASENEPIQKRGYEVDSMVNKPALLVDSQPEKVTSWGNHSSLGSHSGKVAVWGTSQTVKKGTWGK